MRDDDWSDSWFSSDGGGISMWRSEWSNIRSLQDQLDSQQAAAAHERQRLTSQLSKLQGDLTQRVDQLTRAFDAFVELSQLRDELVLHADARRWRIGARRLVESRIAHAPAPASTNVPPDVPGYWLTAVVRTLPDVLEGSADQRRLDQAAGIDGSRTATFLAAAAPLLGVPGLAERWLPTALPATGTTTTNAERALWLAAADGLLGTVALDTVRSALAARLATIEENSVINQLVSAHPPEGPASPGAPKPATRIIDLRAATERGAGDRRTAATTLERWAAWVATAVAPTPAQHIDGDGARAPTDTDDLLLDVVRSLVEEGSPEERPLLDRAEQLAATLNSAATPPTNWDDPAGELLELLAADLADQGHPARARLAVEVLRVPLATSADRLLTIATAPYVPDAAPEVRRTVDLAPDRLVSGQLLAGAAAIFVLSIVLAIAVAPGWIALAVIVAAAVGVAVLRDVVAARADTERAAIAAADATRRAEEQARAVKAAQAAADDAAERARAARDQLDATLAALTTTTA